MSALTGPLILAVVFATVFFAQRAVGPTMPDPEHPAPLALVLLLVALFLQLGAGAIVAAYGGTLWRKSHLCTARTKQVFAGRRKVFQDLRESTTAFTELNAKLNEENRDEPLLVLNDEVGILKEQIADLEEKSRDVNASDDLHLRLDLDEVCKTLSKAARLADELHLPNASTLSDLYGRARRIRLIERALEAIGVVTVASAFAVGFGAMNRLQALLLGPSFADHWPVVAGAVLAGVVLATVLLQLVQHALRWFTEQSWTDLDDILVGVLSSPVYVGILVLSVYQGWKGLPPYVGPAFRAFTTALDADPVLRVLAILLAGWVAIAVFDRIIVLLLRRWAARTDQKYDDLFVEVVQSFGKFVIAAVVGGVVLVSLQQQISEATGGAVQDVLLPYSIVVSVFSAILGLASREAIENFASGIMLQVDKPFVRGERLILESGEVCDVRSIGMRSTVLYNILENTEISIPNTRMAAEKVTNVSRPDWELRIRLMIPLPHASAIAEIEACLLDVANADREVDFARVSRDEIPKELLARDRNGMTHELATLKGRNRSILDTRILPSLPGESEQESVPVFEGELSIDSRMARIARLRQRHRELLRAEQSGGPPNQLERYQILREIGEDFDWIRVALFTVADLHAGVRRDMDGLFSELSKEPSVHTAFELTEEGGSYLMASLNVFTTHLDRRYDVVTRLNRTIEARMANMGVAIGTTTRSDHRPLDTGGLAELTRLHREGALNDDEYARAKQRLLG